MNEISLKFKYMQDEYVKADRQYLIANKTIRKYDPIFVFIILLLSTYYLFISAFSTFGIVLFTITLIASILGGYLYFFMPIYKFKVTSKYHEEYVLQFSNEGIKFKTPSIDSELKWNNYSILWESDDFYFLIQAPHIYTLIPKRAFENAEDKQVFEKIALSNMSNAKHMI